MLEANSCLSFRVIMPCGLCCRMFQSARLLERRHVDEVGVWVCVTLWEEWDFVFEAVQRNGSFGDAAVSGADERWKAHIQCMRFHVNDIT